MKRVLAWLVLTGPLMAAPLLSVAADSPDASF